MIAAQITGLKDILSDFSQLADTKTIARMVNRDIAPPIERRLDVFAAQIPPPRDDTKFVWSFNRGANKRARGWWFWQLSLGNINTDGEHYIRSNVIPNSWQTEIAVEGDEIALTIFNPAEGSEHVYGSEDTPQVPGHATTGWINYKQLLGFIDVVRDETRIAYEELIINTVRRKSGRKR